MGGTDSTKIEVADNDAHETRVFWKILKNMNSFEKYGEGSYFSKSPKKRGIFEKFWKIRQNMKCLGIWASPPPQTTLLIHKHYSTHIQGVWLE